MGSQFVDGNVKAFLSAEALAAFRRVKLDSSGYIVYADARDDCVGVTEAAIANATNGSVRLKSASGTCKITASGAISIDDKVYGADDGKITATPNGIACGRALEAATADGDIIEILPAVEGEIFRSEVTLTAAQIKALAATQQTLIAAPGADKVIEVLGIQMILDYGSEVLAEPSAPDDLEVVYDAAGGTSIADVIGDFIINSADTIAQPQIKNIAGAAASTMVNKAVVLDNTGGEYTGNATGDTTLTVICTYTIHEAGLA
jgi:hypothetical protein